MPSVNAAPKASQTGSWLVFTGCSFVMTWRLTRICCMLTRSSFLIVNPPSLQPTSEGQSLRRKADSPVKTARLDGRACTAPDVTGVGRPAVDEFHEEFSTRAVILLRFSVIAS